MILSRLKPAASKSSTSKDAQSKKQMPKLEKFLEERDYNGAITLLEFDRSSGKGTNETDEWLGYCAFHLGDHKLALLEYDAITKKMKKPPEHIWLHLACCYFFLGMYQESDQAAKKAGKSQLKTRLLFHLSHKFNDEQRLMEYHKQLEDIIPDQLSLASIHYLRSHFQEAIDIYKRILLENRTA